MTRPSTTERRYLFMPNAAHLNSIRRVLAVDAGRRRLKLTLLEKYSNRIKIVREESVDLQEEGLVTAEELKQYLQTALDTWGRPPIAITLPQHLSNSHLIDLPPGSDAEVQQLIEAEVVKLSGVSDTPIISDFVRVGATPAGRPQYWVTLAKEGDVEGLIQLLGLQEANLCDVSTAANSLAAAYLATVPTATQTVLIHLGAQHTLVVVRHQAQTVYAGSFPTGSDSFTRALVQARHCSVAEAEQLKQHSETLGGAAPVPEMVAAVNRWAIELRRFIEVALQQSQKLRVDAATFIYAASGLGFRQPGLLAYLNHQLGMSLQVWPKQRYSPGAGFEIVYGTALQALGATTQPVSLLPAQRQEHWQQHRNTQRLARINNVLLVIASLLLIASLWHCIARVVNQKNLLHKVREATEVLRAEQALTTQFQTEYENLRPLLQARQNTHDLLETLDLLEQTRSNRSFWFVLIADQKSYFHGLRYSATAHAGATNVYGPWLLETSRPSATATNRSPAQPGLIAELSVPENLDDARQVLSSIVNDLKSRPLFSKVDLLTDDLRQNLADPKVLLPERHFALALNFSNTIFQALPPAMRSRFDEPGTSRFSRRAGESPQPDLMQ